MATSQPSALVGPELIFQSTNCAEGCAGTSICQPSGFNTSATTSEAPVRRIKSRVEARSASDMAANRSIERATSSAFLDRSGERSPCSRTIRAWAG